MMLINVNALFRKSSSMLPKDQTWANTLKRPHEKTHGRNTRKKKARRKWPDLPECNRFETRWWIACRVNLWDSEREKWEEKREKWEEKREKWEEKRREETFSRNAFPPASGCETTAPTPGVCVHNSDTSILTWWIQHKIDINWHWTDIKSTLNWH